MLYGIVMYMTEKKPGRPRQPDEHGTVSQYTNRGCRCDECKAAVSEARRRTRQAGLPEGDPRHGTGSGYSNYGCRCDLCKAAVRGYSLSKYGLSESDRTALWEGQGERCASCGDPEPEDSQRRFHIDHDHETGAVRGILCHGCNVSLGHLRDDPERIRALADYIERWRESLPY